MKTLGLIGGISYHSTSVYYHLINQQMNIKAGDHHAAKLLLYSVNYADFKELQSKNDWKGIEVMLSDIANKLEKAGVDCLLICCNTAHLIADELKQKIQVPFIHIGDETAKEILKCNTKKVGLIGTKFIMENPFFIHSLTKSGIEVMVPGEHERMLIHETIITELSKGCLSNQSKEMFQDIFRDLKEQGAEAVVLGCTEMGLFIHQSDCDLKIFDTTIIHANAAVEFALS